MSSGYVGHGQTLAEGLLAPRCTVPSRMDPLSALQKWYLDHCDGDWEHQWGVEIGNIDNPGWRLRINLTRTRKQDAALEKTMIERTEDDWICYWTEDNQFHAACGPENLGESISVFLDWFDSN